MSMKNIVVAGGGVLGSQIAFQTAFKGFNVTIWLRSEGSIGRAKPKLERVKNIYLTTLEQMKTDQYTFRRHDNLLIVQRHSIDFEDAHPLIRYALQVIH